MLICVSSDLKDWVWLMTVLGSFLQFLENNYNPDSNKVKFFFLHKTKNPFTLE